jgi:hypothetical protein
MNTRVAACVVPSSPIFVTMMKEAPGSSETSILTRATRRNNPEDTILHSHCRENLKSYKADPVYEKPRSQIYNRGRGAKYRNEAGNRTHASLQSLIIQLLRIPFVEVRSAGLKHVVIMCPVLSGTFYRPVIYGFEFVNLCSPTSIHKHVTRRPLSMCLTQIKGNGKEN